MAKFNNEIKTGIVVVVAAVLLLIIVWKMGGIKTEKGYEQKCMFNYVSGLESNAPVKLAGVKIGEVKSVGHTYDGDETKVLVILTLNDNARIRRDSKLRISTTGLIGEKYIEVTGGSKGSPVVDRNETLVGIDPFEMEELLETGKTLAARLDSGIQDLQKLINHTDSLLVDNKDDIKVTISNLRDTSESFKEFSDDIRRNPWKLIMKQKEVPKDKKK